MGRKFKEFLRIFRSILLYLGLTVVSVIAIFGIVYIIDLDEKSHIKSCSICHSTNISKVYTDKRGLLSGQRVFYCYNCNKEYNAELLIIRYKPGEK